MKYLYAIAAAPLLLAACADTVPVDEFQPDHSVAELDQVNSGAPAAPAATNARLPQSAAASLNLGAVTKGDFGASIEPGRGCDFTSAANQILLVAAAPLGVNSRPRAVVRLPGGVQSLDAMRDGGYNYLTEGPAFQNRQGLTITVVREDNVAVPAPVMPAGTPTPGSAAAGAKMAAQSWPATMTVITEGAEQEYPQGVYSCGG
ncbi:hypothetical protein [Novosphingopyxis sp.]|uniref:hypothetical protein n=1 Tax=Novosphingopyxis sp. TaxID=2709690 RepID=UPI003B5CF519